MALDDDELRFTDATTHVGHSLQNSLKFGLVVKQLQN